MARVPACPNCQYQSVRAFFSPSYECPKCGKSIRSNLRSVSLVEWLLGGPLLFLLAAALERLPWFNGWSYGALAAVLFVPVCAVHFLVLRSFLILRVNSASPGRAA